MFPACELLYKIIIYVSGLSVTLRPSGQNSLIVSLNQTFLCVLGLQQCEECVGSRPGNSEAADQQTNHQHGVSQHRGKNMLFAPP